MSSSGAAADRDGLEFRHDFGHVRDFRRGQLIDDSRDALRLDPPIYGESGPHEARQAAAAAAERSADRGARRPSSSFVAAPSTGRLRVSVRMVAQSTSPGSRCGAGLSFHSCENSSSRSSARPRAVSRCFLVSQSRSDGTR